MSGYVLVNPGRMTSVAQKLHALHASLSSEPESIRAPYHSWKSDLNVAPLTSSVGRVGDEADKMDDRAVLAYAATTLPRITDPNAPPQTMFGIKWDYSEQDLAVASQQVANSLRRVDEDYPYDGEGNADGYNAAMEQQLRDIGALLDLNRDDETFQQNFWPVAAPIAAKLGEKMRAATGAGENQAPINDEWRRVLSQYSTSFAAASMLDQQGKIELPESTYTPFTQAADEDMWSVGAFIASGPTGDKWASDFLADAGTRVLQWRADHQGEIPTYFPGMMTSGGYSYAGYQSPDGAWYSGLGIDPSDNGANLEEQARRMGLIAANDPALAILGKLGENQAASQQLLSDPTHGATNADRLVEFDWDYVGTQGDESSVPGRVITQATHDRGSDESGRQSAVAAGNVFDAVVADATAERNDYEKENWPKLGAGLQDAVTQTAITYIPDLAASSDEYQDVTTLVTDNGPGGMYTVQMDASSVVGILDIVRDDPNGWGVFRGANDSYLTNATTYQVANEDSPDYIRQATALDALAQLTENNEAYDAAAQRDAEMARVAGYYESASAVLETAAATNNPYVMAADAANRILGPILVDPLFETSYAEEASEQNARSTLDQLNSRTLWIAQGLINGDVIAPPADAPFMQNGNVVIENEADRAEFVAWWNSQPADVTRYEAEARNMFNEITKAHEDNIEQFGG